MKNLVLIIALLVAPMVSFGQSVFDEFEDLDGVTSVVVNQKMFSMLANIEVNMDDAEDQEYFDLIKKITSLKVLTTGDEGISSRMKSKVDSYLKGSKMDELMRIKDGDQTVKFYVKEGKDENHVKELLMFINGLKEITEGQDININGQKREIETVLLSLTGDIDLKQISKLTNKMDLPGGEHLEKAGEKKN
jgi:hypothetical protein